MTFFRTRKKKKKGQHISLPCCPTRATAVLLTYLRRAAAAGVRWTQSGVARYTWATTWEAQTTRLGRMKKI